MLVIAGKEYQIGNFAMANGTSIYRGYVGKINEIRTDKDKETDNDGPDIYLYIFGHGEVIMAPCMLKIIGG